MPLVFVIPCKRILALRLLPKHLEHISIVNKIKALINSLERDAFATDAHLVCKSVSFLLHLCFELAIDHDLLLGAHLRVEKFHCHVSLVQLESPDVLKFRRFDVLADFSDLEVLGHEFTC